MPDKPEGDRWKAFTEEIEVAGAELVERVKALIAEGRVSRLRIKSADGGTMLEVPLTVGAVGGAALALAAPWLAVIGAFAALVAHAKVEIVRDAPPGDDAGSKPSDEPAA
jgi:hypothetical protein